MRLDAERFREERERRGLSLGSVASLIGATRRAVYEYERSSMDIELGKALRILEALGEEVFAPIDVFRVEDRPPEVLEFDEEGERRLAERIIREGGRVMHARRAFTDMAARLGETSQIIVYEHSGERRESVVRRGEAAAEVAEVFSSERIAVVRGRETAVNLEAMGFEVVREPEVRLVKRREGEPEGR